MNQQSGRTTRQSKAKELLSDASKLVRLKEEVARGGQRHVPQQSQRRPMGRR